MKYTKGDWQELALKIMENYEDYSYGFNGEKFVVLKECDYFVLIYNNCKEFCMDWTFLVKADLSDWDSAYLNAKQYEMLGLSKEYSEYLENEKENKNEI